MKFLYVTLVYSLFGFKINANFDQHDNPAYGQLYPNCGRRAMVASGKHTQLQRDSSKSRIVNGQVSSFGQWPFIVHFRIGQRQNNSPYCGGTLIHPRWVLTAAHCFNETNPAIYTARFGEQDLEDDSKPHSDIEVEKIFNYPHYDPKLIFGDISLVKLVEDAPIGDQVSVACLPEYLYEARDGDKCFAVGWGYLNHTSTKMARNLRHVGLNVLDNQKCQTLWYYFPIHDSFLCARDSKRHKGTCMGDSGGPLLQAINRRWNVIGVGSFVGICGDPLKPGVFSKVSHYVGWINDVISQNS